jgi:hypothetical protein
MGRGVGGLMSHAIDASMGVECAGLHEGGERVVFDVECTPPSWRVGPGGSVEMGCSRIGGAAPPSAAPRSMCVRPHDLARVGQVVGACGSSVRKGVSIATCGEGVSDSREAESRQPSSDLHSVCCCVKRRVHQHPPCHFFKGNPPGGGVGTWAVGHATRGI